MTSQEIKNRIAELNKELQAKKAELAPAFQQGLKLLFDENPTVESVRVGINNHEFNDGDATYFSVYYEDLSLTLKDGTEIENDYNKEETESEKLREKFVDYFSEFDVDNFYETLYSNIHESLSFSLQGDKIVTE